MAVHSYFSLVIELLSVLLCWFVLFSCTKQAKKSTDDSKILSSNITRKSPDRPLTPVRVYAPERLRDHNLGGWSKVKRAHVIDEGYASTRMIPIERVVYRVIMRPRLGQTSLRSMHTPAELRLDLSTDRLRAQFIGEGWPLHSDAEIRLRRDATGTYIVDAKGGRPLAEGRLATWFAGKMQRGPVHAALSSPGRATKTLPQRALICALIAEWSNHSRLAFKADCGRGSIPTSFQIGSWYAHRTARIKLSVPRNSMRADHYHASMKNTGNYRASAVASNQLKQLHPNPGEGALSTLKRHGQPCTVQNMTSRRLMIFINQMRIGWLDAKRHVALDGLSPGHYTILSTDTFGRPMSKRASMICPGHHELN